LQIFWS